MFENDDDDSFFSMIASETSKVTPATSVSTAVPTPSNDAAIAAASQMGGSVKAAVEATAVVAGKNHSYDIAKRLGTEIPGLRFMPVRDRFPVTKGWASPTFFKRPAVEMLDEWRDRFGDTDYALIGGQHCGDGGDVIIEADNEAGENWLKANVAETGITTLTRRGFLHRHYRCDIPGRGNRIDVFGEVEKQKKAAVAAGFKIYPRKGASEEEILEAKLQKELSLKAIPMGPLIDIKCTNGQAMMPGGRTSKAPGFRYGEGSGTWTAEAWAARPVFDPEWFPDSVWARDAQLDISSPSSVSGLGYDREYWTSGRREAAAHNYASRMKPSISGEGAHNAFLRNTILCVRGFDLDVPAGRRVMTYWAQQVCSHEPWDTYEIEHKLKEAYERGKEPMGYKLAARNGNETAGERYSKMMRAMAEDIVDDEIEAELMADMLDEVERSALSLVLSNDAAPAPKVVQSSETVTRLEPDDDDIEEASKLIAKIEASNHFLGGGGGAQGKKVEPIDAEITHMDTGEAQLLSEYGMSWDEIQKNPMMGVHFTRVDGKAAKFPPSTLNLSQFFMHSKMFRQRKAGGPPLIRLNTMNHEVEFNGEPLKNIHVLKTRIDTLFQTDVPKDRIEDALETVGLYQHYDPSVEEFAQLPEWDGEPRLFRIAGEILPVEKATLELSATKLAKSVMSMVARTLSPGCKVDTVPILIGMQGGYKSTFWKTLAGDRFFSDTAMQTIGGRDEMWLISRFRVIEMPEIDGVYSKAANAQLKAFFSKTHDSYRLPYARRQVTVARRSIIVGTTNEQEILSDPTGSRRYWPIPTQGRVNLDKLAEWRNQLLAEAIYKVSAHLTAAAAGLKQSNEYLEGQWWMTETEDELRARDNLKYQEDDPWRPVIEDVIRKMTPGHQFMVVDIMDQMKLPIDRLTRKDSNRVVNILINISCQRVNDGRSTSYEGRKGKFWEKPLVPDDDLPF